MKFFWTPEEEQDLKDQASAPQGQIRFDERGNAVYQWNEARLNADTQQAAQQRARALHRELSLVDGDDEFGRTTIVNEKGGRVGYNPYDSGLIPRKPNKHADLRELSKWIETKRRLEAAKRGKG